jgi:hypothetical protein
LQVIRFEFEKGKRFRGSIPDFGLRSDPEKERIL